MPNACYDGKKSNGYKGYWLMNTKNNKKFQETDALMCDMFLKLLDEYAFEDISISLLCQKTGITRATFIRISATWSTFLMPLRNDCS